MQTTTDSAAGSRLRRWRKAVVVTSLEASWLDGAHAASDRSDIDIIVVAPLSEAYSQVKRIQPDLIVAEIAVHDPRGCLALSMLKADRTTRDIPVEFCVTEDEHASLTLAGPTA